MKYYGSKTKKGCKPSDLWTLYFSSSNTIKQIIKEEGAEIFEVRVSRIFDNIEKCIQHERKFLSRVDAATHADWYNKTNGKGDFSRAGISPSLETKQKLSIAAKNRPPLSKEERARRNEKQRGRKRSKISIEKQILAQLGRTISKETKLKISRANKNPSEETRSKMSKINKGRKFSGLFIISFLAIEK